MPIEDATPPVRRVASDRVTAIAWRTLGLSYRYHYRPIAPSIDEELAKWFQSKTRHF